MALLCAEGFEYQGNGTGGQLNNQFYHQSIYNADTWVSVGGNPRSVAGRRVGTQAVELGGSVSGTSDFAFVSGPKSSVITGFAIKVSSYGEQTAQRLLAYKDATTPTLGIALCISDNGLLGYTYEDHQNVIDWTTTTLDIDTWYYIEVRAVFHLTNGEVEIRVDEEIIYHKTNQAMPDFSNLHNISFKTSGGSSSSTLYTLDDVYIIDETGVDNNTFLGDCVVESFLPQSTTLNNWTPNTGTGLSAVNEAIANTTTYVSTTSANTNSYKFDPVLTEEYPIFGVEFDANTSRASSTTSQQIQLNITGSSNTVSVTRPVINATGYFRNRIVAEVNPGSGLLWSHAQLLDIEAGFTYVNLEARVTRIRLNVLRSSKPAVDPLDARAENTLVLTQGLINNTSTSVFAGHFPYNPDENRMQYIRGLAFKPKAIICQMIPQVEAVQISLSAVAGGIVKGFSDSNLNQITYMGGHSLPGVIAARTGESKSQGYFYFDPVLEEYLAYSPQCKIVAYHENGFDVEWVNPNERPGFNRFNVLYQAIGGDQLSEVDIVTFSNDKDNIGEESYSIPYKPSGIVCLSTGVEFEDATYFYTTNDSSISYLDSYHKQLMINHRTIITVSGLGEVGGYGTEYYSTYKFIETSMIARLNSDNSTPAQPGLYSTAKFVSCTDSSLTLNWESAQHKNNFSLLLFKGPHTHLGTGYCQSPAQSLNRINYQGSPRHNSNGMIAHAIISGERIEDELVYDTEKESASTSMGFISPNNQVATSRHFERGDHGFLIGYAGWYDNTGFAFNERTQSAYLSHKDYTAAFENSLVSRSRIIKLGINYFDYQTAFNPAYYIYDPDIRDLFDNPAQYTESIVNNRRNARVKSFYFFSIGQEYLADQELKSTLTLEDDMSHIFFARKNASSALALTHNARGPFPKRSDSLIPLGQTLKSNMDYAREAISPILLTQIGRGGLFKDVVATSAIQLEGSASRVIDVPILLQLDQQISAQLVKTFGSELSLNQLATIMPGATSRLTLNQRAEVPPMGNSLLELTDMAMVVPLPAVHLLSNELVLNQSVFVSKILNPSAISIIELFSGASGLGVLHGCPSPAPSVTDGFMLTGRSVLDISKAMNIGDIDRLAFDRVYRESRGGELIVFADPVWPQTQTLVCSFSGVPRVKAHDYLDFVYENLGEEVQLDLHDGRQWHGIITNTTDPIVEDSFNSFTINLEFEGELSE